MTTSEYSIISIINGNKVWACACNLKCFSTDESCSDCGFWVCDCVVDEEKDAVSLRTVGAPVNTDKLHRCDSCGKFRPLGPDRAPWLEDEEAHPYYNPILNECNKEHGLTYPRLVRGLADGLLTYRAEEYDYTMAETPSEIYDDVLLSFFVKDSQTDRLFCDSDVVTQAPFTQFFGELCRDVRLKLAGWRKSVYLRMRADTHRRKMDELLKRAKRYDAKRKEQEDSDDEDN